LGLELEALATGTARSVARWVWRTAPFASASGRIGSAVIVGAAGATFGVRIRAHAVNALVLPRAVGVEDAFNHFALARIQQACT